jgi:hypothetical protein
VPPALAARVARDLSAPPRAPVTAHALGIRIAGTLLAAQAGAVAVGLALGARPASALVLALPALVAAAALYAGGVALGREAIPGRGPAAIAWALAVGLGFAAALALVWAQERTAPDGPIGLARNYVCLVMGTAVALVPAALTVGVIRAGHAVRPRLAGLVLGALSGLVGLTALHLHCPDVRFVHTGPAHVGVVAALAILGALAGASLLRRRER